MSNETHLREAYYWACLSIVEELEELNTSCNFNYFIDHENILAPFEESDLVWLISAFTDSCSENKKDAAFQLLIEFVRENKTPQLTETMLELTSDNGKYATVLDRTLNPPTRQLSENEREDKKWSKRRDDKERNRVNDWKEWRGDVLSSKSFLLHDEQLEDTLYSLFQLLQQADGVGSGGWDKNLIINAFSTEFLNALRPKLSNFWRQANVPLYSERSKESKNTYTFESLMALTAVKCCSETQNWAKTLSHEEAVKAARISTIELNSFACFLSELEIYHPIAVEEMFTNEAKAQIDDFGEIGQAPIFHEALYTDYSCIKSCTIDAIISKLTVIDEALDKGPDCDFKYAVKLIAKHGSDESKVAFSRLIDNHFDTAELTIDERNSWVALLSLLDLDKAYERVMMFTADVSSEEESKNAVALFAAVFKERHSDSQPTFDSIKPIRRLEILRSLVIRSYRIIKPNEDNNRESGGSFRPNTRDNAERARSYLLQALATIDLVSAISVLYEFSAMTEFQHLSCRLKQMAVELAARISEPEALSETSFNEFDKNFNYLPCDNASLFRVLNNRLDDFEHHLLNDEQSIVDTLRKVDTETELRRFISYWLNQNSRGAYTTTQEAVVASEKRTDIRLQPNGLDIYASIELKLDDDRNKWSGADLKHALEAQLVGRYLNHERCYVGCLLIAMRKTRRWQNPESKTYMNLEETVNWLQNIADKIIEKRPELYLSVKGIDYSKIANE